MSDLQNWMTNCHCIEWLLKNKVANSPITFEEIVMVMIKSNTTSAKISQPRQHICSCAWRWENVFTTTNKYKYMRDNNIVNNVIGIADCYLKYSQTRTHEKVKLF